MPFCFTYIRRASAAKGFTKHRKLSNYIIPAVQRAGFLWIFPGASAKIVLTELNVKYQNRRIAR